MPARKSAESVRAYINKYGFDFRQGHTYHNNYTYMSLVNLRNGRQSLLC